MLSYNNTHFYMSALDKWSYFWICLPCVPRNKERSYF